MVTMNTIAYSGVLNKIETAVLLELHDKINLSGLLYNAESWNLNKGEEGQLEKPEIKAIKDPFNPPIHTPTAAIIYTLAYSRQSNVFTSKCSSIYREFYREKIMTGQKKPF